MQHWPKLMFINLLLVHRAVQCLEISWVGEGKKVYLQNGLFKCHIYLELRALASGIVV